MEKKTITFTKETVPERSPGSSITASSIESVLPMDSNVAKQFADLNEELFKAKGIDQEKLSELLIMLWFRIILAEMPDVLEADPALSPEEVINRLNKQGKSSQWKIHEFGDWKFPPHVFEAWVENVRQAAVDIIDSRTNLLATPQKIAEAKIPEPEKLKLLGKEGFISVSEQNVKVLLAGLKSGMKVSIMNYKHGTPAVAKHRMLELGKDKHSWVFELDNLQELSLVNKEGYLGNIGKPGWLLRVEGERELL